MRCTSKNNFDSFRIDFITGIPKEILGTKVQISHKKNNSGKIEIEYYSNEELERIIELLESVQNH